MACLTPADRFRQATEAFVDEIRKKASPRGIFYNLINRKTYPQGVGFTQSTFLTARSLPTTDEPEFVTVNSIPGTAGGLCATTFNAVDVGYTETTFTPEQYGWKGPPFCPDELFFSMKLEGFIRAYIKQMSMNTTQTIENRLAAIYDHYVPKTVADTALAWTDVGSGHPPQSPDLSGMDQVFCELTQEFLDAVAVDLNEIAAWQSPFSDDWFSLGDEGHVYPLMIGQEASHRIVINNADRRQDYRDAWNGAGQNAPTVNRIGAPLVIGNFRHVVVSHPPRYRYDSQEGYVRIATWREVDVTKGHDVEINPAWKTAEYEGARVLSPDVFYDQIVPPLNSVAGLTWTPRNYLGEWQFVTGGYKIADAGAACVDPLDKQGRHYAEFKHAAEPVDPEKGRLIIFRRCPATSISCETCT